MKISVIHITARVKPMGSFPQGWLGACVQRFEACDHPEDVEYVVVVHQSRAREFWWYATGMDKQIPPYWGTFKLVVNYGRDCIVDQANTGRLAASGEIFAGMDDDLVAPSGWDTAIRAAIMDTSAPVALQFPSERPDLLTNPTVHTRVLDRLIGPFDPEYIGMFADDDWAACVRKHGRIVWVPGTTFEHSHPLTNGRNQIDDVYRMENDSESYDVGEKVLAKRRAAGFPRVELPGWENELPRYRSEDERLAAGDPTCPVPMPSKLKRMLSAVRQTLNPPPVVNPRRNIAVCLPGESFHYEWMASMLSVQGKLMELGFDFKAIFSYSTLPHVTRMSLTESVLQYHAGDRLTPYVLWIDDDNIVPVSVIERWVKFFEANEQCDILTGWCWIQRGLESRISVGTINPDGTLAHFSLEQLFSSREIRKVDGLAGGFPCVMMRREVLERLGAKAFIPIPAPESAHGQLGEDLSFFTRANEAGMNLYVDPFGKVGHLKVQSLEPPVIYDVNNPEARAIVEQVRGKHVHAPEAYREVVS